MLRQCVMCGRSVADDGSCSHCGYKPLVAFPADVPNDIRKYMTWLHRERFFTLFGSERDGWRRYIQAAYAGSNIEPIPGLAGNGRIVIPYAAIAEELYPRVQADALAWRDKNIRPDILNFMQRTVHRGSVSIQGGPRPCPSCGAKGGCEHRG